MTNEPYCEIHAFLCNLRSPLQYISYFCVIKGHLCTPYVCVVKGSSVHLYVCVVKSHLCTPYVCVVKGSPVHLTSVWLRVISVHLTYVSLRGHLYTVHLCG